MYKIIFLLCFLIPDVKPASGKKTIVDKVDVIELNHRYDDEERHCYDQYIMWEWSPDYKRYHVVAWTLDEQKSNNLRKVTKDHNTGKYVLTYVDSQTGLSRKIYAPIYKETSSSSDPERENKEIFPEKYRRGLSKK